MARALMLAAAGVVPAVTFPVIGVPEVKPDSCTAVPDLCRAVYATASRVTCIDRDGTVQGQLDFPPASSQRPNACNRCEFSLDGTVAWAYRPDDNVKPTTNRSLQSGVSRRVRRRTAWPAGIRNCRDARSDRMAS